MHSTSTKTALTQASLLLQRANSLLVLTGAGISVPSGIKPYRGPGGLYTSQPELQHIMTGANWQRNPESVWQAINQKRLAYQDASPNLAHKILAKWELDGRFSRFHLATQNIDGLHLKAGSLHCNQIHGNLWEMARPRLSPVAEGLAIDWMHGSDSPQRREALLKWSHTADAEIWRDDTIPFKKIPPYDDPRVRPNVVLFDEPYGSRLLATLDFIEHGCDLMLVIGCSGGVSIVDQLVDTLLKMRPSCNFIFINPSDHPDELLKACRLPMDAVEALATLDQILPPIS